MTRVLFTRLVLFTVVSLSLISCSGLAGEPEIVSTLAPSPTQQVVPVSAPVMTPSLSLGASVFAEHCTRCHGLEGKGDGELVLSGQIGQPVDFTLPETNDTITPMGWYGVITNGRMDKQMPFWSGSLSDVERWSAAMYVYTLAYPSDDLVLGEAVYSTECAACHGDTGAGTNAGSALTDLWDKSDGDLMVVWNESGDGVHASVQAIPPEDRGAVVAYVRSLGITADDPHAQLQVAAGAEPAMPGAAVSMGAVEGQIVHGTAGGVVPVDMTVKLHVLDDDFNGTTIDTVADSDGHFTFENVRFDANHTFIASVEYQDGTYVSDFVRGSGDITTLELPVTIYDLTYDPSVVTIKSIIAQVSIVEDTLQVVEIVELLNGSDRIYMGTDAADDAGGQRHTASLTLPDRAGDVAFQEGDRFELSADGRQVIDSLPVLPGDRHTIHLAYSLPKSDPATISQMLDFALDGSVEIYVDASTTAIEAQSLNSLGTMDAGESMMAVYGGTLSMAAGDRLTYTVAEVASTAGGYDSRTLIAGGMMMLGVVMVAGSGVLFWRSRQNGISDPDTDPVTVESLMREIAELDMRYEAGEITESKYQRQRSILKARAAALMKGQR